MSSIGLARSAGPAATGPISSPANGVSAAPSPSTANLAVATDSHSNAQPSERPFGRPGQLAFSARCFYKDAALDDPPVPPYLMRLPAKTFHLRTEHPPTLKSKG
jgi:hypothetical protein